MSAKTLLNHLLADRNTQTIWPRDKMIKNPSIFHTSPLSGSSQIYSFAHSYIFEETCWCGTLRPIVFSKGALCIDVLTIRSRACPLIK